MKLDKCVVCGSENIVKSGETTYVCGNCNVIVGVDLHDGCVYEVIGVKGNMFVFFDSSNKKRIRNMNNKCFSKIKK